AGAETDQRDARGQQAVLRKRLRLAERQAEVGAETLEIAPHVAALGRVEIERRTIPALLLEDRTEQEWPEADGDAGLPRQRPDAQRRRIRIGRGEIEPELERG